MIERQAQRHLISILIKDNLDRAVLAFNGQRNTRHGTLFEFRQRPFRQLAQESYCFTGIEQVCSLWQKRTWRTIPSAIRFLVECWRVRTKTLENCQCQTAALIIAEPADSTVEIAAFGGIPS